jgi:hypothetical protein
VGVAPLDVRASHAPVVILPSIVRQEDDDATARTVPLAFSCRCVTSDGNAQAKKE